SQALQPVRHHQQRTGHRAEGPYLLQPAPALAGHPDTTHHLGLTDIQCRDPSNDLLIVLRDFHPAPPPLDEPDNGPVVRRSCRETANLILVLEATLNGPHTQLPAPD